MSAVAGYVTDNGLVGALVGGNLTGGIIGDVLNDSDRKSSSCGSEPAPNNDGGWGPSGDNCSPTDSGSSSGSFGD
ncbi:MAG: hypothetical protein WA082_04130 [Candidatus Moraniibacteriota bacterium]